MSLPRKPLLPAAFGVTFVLQLLGAIAAFLAAQVLPLNFPELAGSTTTILNTLGGILLGIAAVNLLFGHRIARLLQHLGIRSRVLLPREGLVYLGVMLILAVGALLGHSNMLLLVFGLMAGPFVLNGWVVISMLHRVSVSRQLPLAATDGAPFSVELTLRNDKSMLASRLIEVRDVIEGQRVRQEAEVTFVHVAPRSARSGTYQLRIIGRGVYRFGPVRISSRFPLGIGERGTTANLRAELYVHPASGRLLPDWLRRERELSESLNPSHARIGVFDDDFHRVREFRSGDNPRSIHWRTSARKGELMVREFEQRREADLIVLLDLKEQPDFGAEEVEMAVSLAATICIEQTRHTAAGQYRLLISGKEPQDIHCSGGSRFRDAALNALAICQPSVKASLIAMVSAVSGTAATASERLILITPRPDEARRILAVADSERELRSLHSHTTLIPATTAEMLRVFVPPRHSPDRREER